MYELVDLTIFDNLKDTNYLNIYPPSAENLGIEETDLSNL
jgi:hypothetical protein